MHIFNLVFKADRTEKWLYLLLAISSIIAFFVFSAPVHADGPTRVSGIGYFDPEGVCNDPVTGPQGQAPDFANIMAGDFEGCLYVFVERAECRPGGAYVESGTELFVGRDSDGNEGTFRTVYHFSAAYEDCPTFTGQIYGGCKHPIIAGSGTDDFKGIRGRLDFVDDVEAGNFPYSGFIGY